MDGMGDGSPKVVAFPRLGPAREGEVPRPLAPVPAPSPTSEAEEQQEPIEAPQPRSSMAEAQVARMSFAIEGLRHQAERLAEQARSDALEIGFQVARRILERELTTSPEPLFQLVRSAVRRVGDARTVTVRLNPDDLKRIQAAGGGTAGELSLAQLQLVADPTLKPGDCFVESELGSVDGRLDTRLKELRRGLDVQTDEEDVG